MTPASRLPAFLWRLSTKPRRRAGVRTSDRVLELTGAQANVVTEPPSRARVSRANGVFHRVARAAFSEVRKIVFVGEDELHARRHRPRGTEGVVEAVVPKQLRPRTGSCSSAVQRVRRASVADHKRA